MKVTMKSIADVVGVSVNTVSLALRGMPGVKVETRNKIFETAKQLGYIGPKAVTEAKNVCIVSTAERLRDSYFFMNFYQIILEKVQKYGYNMLVFHSNNITSTEAFTRNLKANSVSGIIMLGDMDEASVEMVASSGIPVIGIGSRYYKVAAPIFIEDNLGGAHQAVEYLYEHGYRSIGYIGRPTYSTAFMERYEGFLGAMHRFGLQNSDAQNIMDIIDDGRYDANLMEKNMKKLKALPEAFVCANDNLALTAAKALDHMGIRIPDDIALIGFDNSASGKMYNPSITSVDVCCEAQAEASVRKLMSYIEHDTPDVKRYLIPVVLVEGDSVRQL